MSKTDSCNGLRDICSSSVAVYVQPVYLRFMAQQELGVGQMGRQLPNPSHGGLLPTIAEKVDASKA